MKNSTRCNEELVTRVRATIDEDARTPLEEIAGYLNISSRSAVSILQNSLGYCSLREMDHQHLDAPADEGYGSLFNRAAQDV